MIKLPIFPNGRRPDEFCLDCGAFKTCNHPRMDGHGAKKPIYVIVGEAPGSEEDTEGVPFIGDAGGLLRELVEEAGISDELCYYTNAAKCRPPNNNIKHYPNIIDQCRPHLLREIHSLNPKVVILLGNTATQSVLNRRGIMSLQGEVFDTGRWKYICCFHPSYLLRNNTPQNRKKMVEIFKKAKSLGQPKKVGPTKKRTHVFVQDHKTLQEMRDHLLKQKYLTTDIEGSTLNAYSKVRPAKIGCIGFGWSGMEACCFALESRVGMDIKVPQEEFLEVAKEIHESPDIKHILHFGKYDFVYEAVLHDIWIGGKDRTGYYADTGQMSYVNNERPGGHGLKDWAYKFGMGGYELPKRQFELANPNCDASRGGNANYVPFPLLGAYNMDDCIADWRLFWGHDSFKGLKDRLKEQNLWQRPFKFPQMWHAWTAAILEINGLRISRKRNVELDELYREQIDKLDKDIKTYPEIKKLQRMRDRKLLADVHKRVISYKRPVPNVFNKVKELFENISDEKRLVNLNAPETRRTLVFKILKYPVTYWTETGLASVKKEFLEELLKTRKEPVLGKMIQRNEYESSHSKYIAPVARDWMGTDGRTHTTYNPHGQLTGRVSSKDPNHENLPKRGRLAKELRSQFTSTNGDYYIVEQDSKQMEMRLFCDRAKDDVMTQEFNDGKDPHAMGAMAGFEISQEKWDRLPIEKRKKYRDDAKSAVSFGLLYGRGAPALAADFGKSIRWAEKFIERYFGKYDDCRAYIADRKEYILKHKIVYSYFFRPRRLPEVDSDVEAMSAEAARQGINSPIQGDCSDITWVALHRLSAFFRKYKMKSKAIIAVHDAGYADAYHKELPLVIEKLHEYMTDRKFIEKMTGWYCEVPWETDCMIGPNLGTMTELKLEKGIFTIPSELHIN